jgi:hypothetical protein
MANLKFVGTDCSCDYQEISCQLMSGEEVKDNQILLTIGNPLYPDQDQDIYLDIDTAVQFSRQLRKSIAESKTQL